MVVILYTKAKGERSNINCLPVRFPALCLFYLLKTSGFPFKWDLIIHVDIHFCLQCFHHSGAEDKLMKSPPTFHRWADRITYSLVFKNRSSYCLHENESLFELRSLWFQTQGQSFSDQQQLGGRGSFRLSTVKVTYISVGIRCTGIIINHTLFHFHRYPV